MYWYYLDSESFFIRQYSILPFLENIDNIIEIGPGKNPISKFVKNKNIILIEPDFEFEIDKNNNITHINKKIQDINLDELNIIENYALIIFGLDWEMCEQQKILWYNSKIAIFETVTELDKHNGLIEELKSIKKPDIEYDLHIHYEEKNQREDAWPPRTKRKILIYKNDK